MELFQLTFVADDTTWLAEVELEGIGDSWDAHVKIPGYQGQNELHVKFWLDNFLKPVFSSKTEAKLFEPLLEAIDTQAKLLLPATFGDE